MLSLVLKQPHSLRQSKRLNQPFLTTSSENPRLPREQNRIKAKTWWLSLVNTLESSNEIIISSEPRNPHLIKRSDPVRSLASCAPALCGASSAIRAPLVAPLVAVGVVVRISCARARGSVLVQSTISDAPACSGQHTPGNLVEKLGLSLIRHRQLVSQNPRCGRREKLHISITGSGFPHTHHQHQAHHRNHDRGAPPSGRHLLPLAVNVKRLVRKVT